MSTDEDDLDSDSTNKNYAKVKYINEIKITV